MAARLGWWRRRSPASGASCGASTCGSRPCDCPDSERRPPRSSTSSSPGRGRSGGAGARAAGVGGRPGSGGDPHARRGLRARGSRSASRGHRPGHGPPEPLGGRRARSCSGPATSSHSFCGSRTPHWLDEAAAEFMSFLLPTLADDPVGLLVTGRPELGGSWIPPDIARLTLSPLDEEAARALLGDLCADPADLGVESWRELIRPQPRETLCTSSSSRGRSGKAGSSGGPGNGAGSHHGTDRPPGGADPGPAADGGRPGDAVLPRRSFAGMLRARARASRTSTPGSAASRTEASSSPEDEERSAWGSATRCPRRSPTAGS